ncbi:MAG: YbhB/YbcL family Raf kinase inhibitor-like protein [Calditrichaeota bacterium]|nr:YbhB/YbcL family Raf kinase inhibitor-like protein [Calditrichota bacterium]
MSFILKSPAFEHGKPIPLKYTCDGPDVSPPLSWSGTPAGTKSFVLICDDPDAPVGTWVHWVIYNIPGDRTELPEGVAKENIVLEDVRQGINDFQRIGYGGPCPPGGKPHRYFFKLYALDIESNWEAGLTKEEVLEKMENHVLGQTELMGTYQR